MKLRIEYIESKRFLVDPALNIQSFFIKFLKLFTILEIAFKAIREQGLNPYIMTTQQVRIISECNENGKELLYDPKVLEINEDVRQNYFVNICEAMYVKRKNNLNE